MMTVSVNQTTNFSDHWAKLFSAQRLGSHKKAPAEDSARSDQSARYSYALNTLARSFLYWSLFRYHGGREAA